MHKHVCSVINVFFIQFWIKTHMVSLRMSRQCMYVVVGEIQFFWVPFSFLLTRLRLPSIRSGESEGLCDRDSEGPKDWKKLIRFERNTICSFTCLEEKPGLKYHYWRHRFEEYYKKKYVDIWSMQWRRQGEKTERMIREKDAKQSIIKGWTLELKNGPIWGGRYEFREVGTVLIPGKPL